MSGQGERQDIRELAKRVDLLCKEDRRLHTMISELQTQVEMLNTDKVSRIDLLNLRQPS